MGDLIPTRPAPGDPSEQPRPIPSTEPANISRDSLQLAPFAAYSFTTQFAGMSASPSSARRRATLTASQAWQHASGSFLAPELHTHEDWVYRSTDTIPEAGYSGPSSGPHKSSSDLGAIATPPTVATTFGESRPPPAPSSSLRPMYTRPRAYSHNPISSTKGLGVHYSSAHRREPSSPSFRSPALPYPHAYFDRPPSPASSISSRSSEPIIGASLSLSEILAGALRTPVGEYSHDPEDERIRREEQREIRRLAMLERQAALIEQREKRRWSKAAQAGCIEWVENNTKW